MAPSDQDAAHRDGDVLAHRADALKSGDPDAIAMTVANVMAEDGYILPIPLLAGTGLAL